MKLASLEAGQTAEYEELLAKDELRHPLLVSVRVHVKQRETSLKEEPQAKEESEASQTPESEKELFAVAVEVEPCTCTDIPNESLEAIHGLLAGAQTSDRLAVVPLDKLKPSPFYNMVAEGKPAEKALTLLHFTQRGNGHQHAHGFRIITERVRDATAGAATELTNEKCYATIALCTVAKIPDFSVGKDATAMAVISKVVAPSNMLHAADLYIEAMEVVPKHDIPSAMEMMRQLQRVSVAQSADPTTSTEVAWQQRK